MKKMFVLIVFSLIANRTYAVDGVSVEYGRGNMVEMARVGLVWNWDKRWMEGEDWQVTGFWEAALGVWHGYKPNDNNQTISELGVTPVFRLTRKDGEGVTPYLEGGFLGMHLISPTFIYSGRKFGSSFQFGNHLGFGGSFGEHHQFDLGYRFQHMSNADIKQPNQGINSSQIHFIYRF